MTSCKLSKVIPSCLSFVLKRKKALHFNRNFGRKMTDVSNHLERTAESGRNNITSLATVIGLRQESTTVKSLRLKIHDERLIFKAGQWVDMFMPEVDIVGGFSMYSSPEQLQREGTIDLAVKYSTHPPALWVHTKCNEGTKVYIRVGGDIYYDPGVSEPPHDLLLIAGGIGINPLLSILYHVRDLITLKKKGNLEGDKLIPQKVLLLYSAAKQDELICKNQIEKIVSANDEIKCKFFVTQAESSNGLKAGRIGKEDIKESFNWLKEHQTKTYICGPSPMITDMEKLLIGQGLDKKTILYEKWWIPAETA
ncbi:oxidoreductase NAD-binding domain-containing protein 1-like [Mytilus californianus]|uniref:oxidoreductase NAD-binding domain-containing protein 1-like n=1 Tax=Mytilus californianus TaxID=6549 RepID=UPI002246D3E0|nr:oxidoreductase NAD-binding domain-containing protein 1-like [Mytilus californianus]